MQYEKGHGKLSCTEFLLDFQAGSCPSKDEAGLVGSFTVEPGWQDKLLGKRIVCFAFSQKTIVMERNNDIFAVLGILNYVLDTFRQAEGFVLWWLDDGQLEMALESVKEKPGEEGRCQQVAYGYRDFLKKLDEKENAIHDGSGNLARALAWADVYYGDECVAAEAFRKTGKPVFLQDTQRQNQSVGRHSYLTDWLDMVTSVSQAESWQEPVGWREASQGRKVVLYYSTALALLSLGEQAVEKYERVTRMALARQGMCFYWLAEAGTEQALSLLTSDLRERFHACCEAFMAAPNCCFDEANSISSALHHADVYYGSDVFWLDDFRKAGKPVAYQSFGQRLGADHILPHLQHETFGLSFMDGVWVGENYYFPASLGNGLFRLPKGSDRAEYVSHIPVEGVKSRVMLFSAIEHYEGKLFLIPSQARDIMVFDLKTHDWGKIPVSREYAWDNPLLFISAERQGELLWLLPLDYYAVGCLNLRTSELSYVAGWGDKIAAKITNPGSQHFVKGLLAGEQIAFAAIQSSHLVLVSTLDGRARTYELETEGEGFMGLAYDGREFWLINKQGDLLRWSPQAGIVERRENVLENGFVGCMIYHSGCLWGFPLREDYYVKHDISTGKSTRCEHYLPEELRPGFWSMSLQKDERYIYILPNSSEVATRLEPATGEVTVYTIRLAERDKEKYIKAQFQKNVLGDGEFIDDNEMATWLECCGSIKVDRALAGQAIFKRIMEEISR